MSRTRRRDRRREREPEVEVDWATPVTGALGLVSQAPAIAIAPPRLFVIACEVPGCEWESAEESTVVACKRDLVAHAWAAHSRRAAEAVDVRVRSRKHRFPIEVVDQAATP